MTNQEFISNCLRTESDLSYDILLRTLQEDPSKCRLLHGIMGLETETGELMDNLKKCLFYGKPSDKVNLLEEVGDVLWYLSIICHSQGFTLDSAMETVINKLKIRYPEKFETDLAINRNLLAERNILEGTRKL